MKKTYRIILALGALAALSACDDLGEALGMSHSRPDEGTIVTNQPLALPPDYTLKPPRETSKDVDPASTDHPASPDPDLEKHH
jgi:hypothetical protein